MNTNKYILSLLIIPFTLIVEPVMAAKQYSILDSGEFAGLINKDERHNKINTITGVAIKGFTLPFSEITSTHFVDSQWSSIDSRGKIYNKVLFENCELNNVDFEKSTLNDVTFRGCILHNVIMNNSKTNKLVFENSKIYSTDPNITRSYRNLEAGDIFFINSELKNINFFESKGMFHFERTTLNDVSGVGLLSGSSLSINSSNAFDVNFSDSKLSALTVKNSTINESKANNCTIERIFLENSKLNFPIADGKSYGTVIANNSNNISIGGTPTNKNGAPVKNVTITGCGESDDIYIGDMLFENISIDGCSPTNLIFFESKGGNLSISNATVYELDFRMANIEHLILNNVHIRSRLYYDAAKIKKLELKNISFDRDIEITNEDANIEINPDNILPLQK